MLSKKNRLYREKDINKTLKDGKTFFLPEFIIKYYFNNEKEIKVGFITSTKVDKRAIKRNTLKRKLREITRTILPNLKKGYYLLIIAKKPALKLNTTEIKQKLIFAFSQIKTYNK